VYLVSSSSPRDRTEGKGRKGRRIKADLRSCVFSFCDEKARNPRKLVPRPSVLQQELYALSDPSLASLVALNRNRSEKESKEVEELTFLLPSFPPFLFLAFPTF